MMVELSLILNYKALATKIKNSEAQAVFILSMQVALQLLQRMLGCWIYITTIGADGWDGASTILAGEDGKGDVTPLNNSYFSNHYALMMKMPKRLSQHIKQDMVKVQTHFRLGYDVLY